MQMVIELNVKHCLESLVKGYISPLIDFSEDSFFSKFEISDSELTNNDGSAIGKNENDIRALFIIFRRY